MVFLVCLTILNRRGLFSLSEGPLGQAFGPGSRWRWPPRSTLHRRAAGGIAVSGSSAYVADGANGWLIYDVSNPASPTIVKANAEPGPVLSVAVAGVLATLGNGTNAAVTMDVT